LPFVEIKAFEHHFEDEAVADRLIAAVTDAVAEVFGEGSRKSTWVVVNGIPPKRWGIGGERGDTLLA
jgi:4-oxalocrotonate tautomerase